MSEIEQNKKMGNEFVAVTHTVVGELRLVAAAQ